MQLLAIRRAAILFFLPLERTNPTGKAVNPQLVQLMQQRYGFMKVPQTAGDWDFGTGVLFGMGAFREFAIDEIRLFDNGIAISSGGSTDVAEEIFDDLTALLVSIGLSFSPDLITRRDYVSQLVCRMEGSFESINRPLHDLVARTLPARQPTSFAQISFLADDKTDNAGIIRVERTADENATGPNQYWSSASLRTSEHLEFLRGFEEILISGGAALSSPDPAASTTGSRLSSPAARS